MSPLGCMEPEYVISESQDMDDYITVLLAQGFPKHSAFPLCGKNDGGLQPCTDYYKFHVNVKY